MNIDVFILVADRVLLNYASPEPKPHPMTEAYRRSGLGQVSRNTVPNLPPMLIDLCHKSVEQGLTSSRPDRFRMCVDRLTALGCDGSDLLARLFAARFVKELAPYACALLEEIRVEDPELVFEINNLAQHHSGYLYHVSPFRYHDYAAFSEYVDEHGWNPGHGQRFGLLF